MNDFQYILMTWNELKNTILLLFKYIFRSVMDSGRISYKVQSFQRRVSLSDPSNMSLQNFLSSRDPGTLTNFSCSK